MMFPNRDLSANKKPQKYFLRLDTAFYILILFAVSVGAGQFTTSGFNNVANSNNVLILGDSVFIAPRETLTVPILKDIKLTDNSCDSSYAAEVVASVNGKFCFFWAEYDGVNHHVYRREAVLTGTDCNLLPQKCLYSNSSKEISFLHAERGSGPDSYVVSFSRIDSISVCADNNDVKFKSKPNNSMCYFSSDIFCIIYKAANVDLGARKVRLSSGDVVFADGGSPGTISKNGDGATGNFSNSSVAIDNSGNVLVITTRGGSAETKYLVYKLITTNYIKNDSNNIANGSGVSINTVGDIKYADAPIVSYGDKKFASVFWKTNDIYLCKLEVTGAIVTTNTSSSIMNGTTFRAPTVATNGKKLVVVWKNFANWRLEGKQYKIDNGVLSGTSTSHVFSDASSTVDTSGPELNAAVDAAGSIALAWKQGTDAVGAIWSDKGIMYPTAGWVSAVASVTVIPGDSIVFLPGAVDTTLNGGAIAVYLQVGPTTDTSVGWSPWISLASATDLAQYTKGTCNYFRYKADFTRHSTDSIKTPVLNEVTVNWNLKPRITTLDSVKVNGTAASGISGFGDTVDVISHTDIIDCYFTAHDGDVGDIVFISVPWSIQPEEAKDTLTGTVDLSGHIRLNPDIVWDTIYSCIFSGNDNQQWGAISRNLYIRSRKAAPVITSVTFDGISVADSSPAPIVIGKPTVLNVTIERPNVVAWNKIRYRFVTNLFDTSFTTASQLVFAPRENDINMQIIVTDMFGAADTVLLFFKYPKYTVDSLNNPAYFLARKKLADSLSFILGSSVSADTVLLPILNTGNDTLAVDSIFFTGSSVKWLRLGVRQDAGFVFFDSLTSSQGINPLRLPPDSISPLIFIIDTRNLSGDNVLYDRVFIWTNDPVFPVDTVNVMLVHNDLPVITSLDYEFEPGIPCWQQKWKAKRGDRGYIFPPHAKIKLTFSEPMDTNSAAGNISAFSIFDSTVTGVIDTITLIQTWRNTDTLLLKANYQNASTYFNGLKPPLGIFIPTDSIGVIISSDLTDMATTPGGPNHIDFNHDFIGDVGTDTIIRLRVDSIHFTIIDVSPKASAINVPLDVPLVLTFSAPIFFGSVDTSLINNRSLLITTRYNSLYDSLRQIVFDSVYIDGNMAVFIPAKRFFFGDSVYCYYRGVGARDTLGYPVDMNKDGIPINLFDSASTEDDFSWSFLINDIVNDSVIPDNRATGVSMYTPISMVFSTPLFPGLVDTARVGNRSLKVTSLYSEGNRIDFDSVRVNQNRATFYLNHRLFYLDSVFCEFSGLLTKDTTLFSVDMTGDTVYSTQKRKSWYFIVEELAIESVNPDSAATNAGVRDPIKITFSGPISPAIFDTCTDADSNKSFFFTTSYGGGKRMAMSRIQFTLDSITVIVYTQKAYFSYDSVYCEFAGFQDGYSYITEKSLLPLDTGFLLSAYSWYFLTGNEVFYTYPNPYKPGSNRRHRDLGGIWFKNLHVLGKKRGKINNIKIRVFNINTHPVFESNIIHFEDRNPDKKPEWFWRTTNNRGSHVASGVYFYAIYDKKDKVLLKGKILIVR